MIRTRDTRSSPIEEGKRPMDAGGWVCKVLIQVRFFLLQIKDSMEPRGLFKRREWSREICDVRLRAEWTSHV
jgi:hypothetical protein